MIDANTKISRLSREDLGIKEASYEIPGWIEVMTLNELKQHIGSMRVKLCEMDHERTGLSQIVCPDRIDNLVCGHCGDDTAFEQDPNLAMSTAEQLVEAVDFAAACQVLPHSQADGFKQTVYEVASALADTDVGVRVGHNKDLLKTMNEVQGKSYDVYGPQRAAYEEFVGMPPDDRGKISLPVLENPGKKAAEHQYTLGKPMEAVRDKLVAALTGMTTESS